MAVTGNVVGLVLRNTDRESFTFDIDSVSDIRSGQTYPVNIRARLSQYLLSYDRKTTVEHRVSINPGDYLQLRVKLRPPDTTHNPHGFDYVGHLFAQGVRYVGYIRQSPQNQVIAHRPNLWQSILTEINALRQHIKERVDVRHQGIIEAMSIGVRNEIPPEQMRVLRETGTAHLISISGIHISFVIFFVFVIIGAICYLIPRVVTVLPAQKLFLLASIPAALFYALLAGFNYPVSRSFFMLLTIGLCVLSGGVSASLYIPLLLAMFVVVAIDPWAVISNGFWLSFLTVGIIVFLLSIKKTTPKQRFHQFFYFLRTTLLISVFVIPLSVYFFFSRIDHHGDQQHLRDSRLRLYHPAAYLY